MSGSDYKAKKIVLTRHAEQKLEERGLKREWVERTARNPYWIDQSPETNRQNAALPLSTNSAAACCEWSVWRLEMPSVL